MQRHPSLAGIEMKQVRRLPSDTGAQLTESVRVAMNVGGALSYRCRGSTSLIPPGAVAIVEPGEVHIATAKLRYLNADIISIDPRALSWLTQDNPGILRTGFSLREPVRTSQVLLDAFRGLSETLRDSAAPSLLAEEHTLLFLDALYRELNASRLEPAVDPLLAGREAVRRAREMIHHRYSETFSLDELAKVSRLPKLRLLRTFKRLVGVPPHAYQMHLRLDHARRLVARGSSLSDAAASAGFCDQSHFHRLFVRCWGMTPGDYRGRHGGKAP